MTCSTRDRLKEDGVCCDSAVRMDSPSRGYCVRPDLLGWADAPPQPGPASAANPTKSAATSAGSLGSVENCPATPSGSMICE